METQNQSVPGSSTQTVQYPGKPLVKKFSSGKKENVILAIVAIIVVVAGVGTGWLLSGKKGSLGKLGKTPSTINTQKEAGSTDASTFKDTATGTLKSGGIAGEGTHHLERDGGTSQYVYLTSTVIDLESFVEKKVQVWGQTMTAKKAGWLMDVGKVKVLE
jgi:hypothetical protein